MVDVVKENLKDIINTCKKYHVQSLYLFGSAARGNDFKQTSDIDFIVNYSLPSDIDVFFRVENSKKLQKELEAIVKRKVDLIQEQNIRNKYMRYFINKDKQMIYGFS